VFLHSLRNECKEGLLIEKWGFLLYFIHILTLYQTFFSAATLPSHRMYDFLFGTEGMTRSLLKTDYHLNARVIRYRLTEIIFFKLYFYFMVKSLIVVTKNIFWGCFDQGNEIWNWNFIVTLYFGTDFLL
jgi:hypothetical protein